jgi:ribosome biogenesis GTPase
MSERCGDLVIRVHGGHHYVQTDQGVVDCKIRGLLKRRRRGSDLVAIGDRVCWTSTEDGGGIIESVAPRTRVLSRRPPSTRPGDQSSQEQVIVANPDQVLVVFAHHNPEPNPLMLDRYLVACESAEIPVILVANKHDLLEPDEEDPFQVYRDIGYSVVPTSTTPNENVETLRGLLKGKLSVLTGPSGAGKSSLLNALWPGLELKTGEISAFTDRGKHTTVVASLLNPEPDIYVADTPGLRVFMYWDIEPEHLDAYFPEMRQHREHCRFHPCTHTHEPDCGVQQAVAQGEIDPLRYESYCKMFENAF